QRSKHIEITFKFEGHRISVKHCCILTYNDRGSPVGIFHQESHRVEPIVVVVNHEVNRDRNIGNNLIVARKPIFSEYQLNRCCVNIRGRPECSTAVVVKTRFECYRFVKTCKSFIKRCSAWFRTNVNGNFSNRSEEHKSELQSRE